jgi:uncharacterized repeat protein (TIGR03803 family)
MRRKHSAEVIGVRLETAQSRVNSYLKKMILAAAVLLCAGAVAGAQTVATVYNFVGGSASGANPWYVTLVQGTDGQLYGTTYNGGTAGLGTAFKVTTSGTLTLLHSFAGGATDGANPTGGLTLGTDGNFYGTTQMGGAGNEGVVFKMTTTGTVTVLHTFNDSTDGAFPWSAPILASDGNFYGTASGGAANNGLVYKITTSGTYTTIFPFDGVHGTYPIAAPTQGTDGNLYVPVSEGGSSFCGTIVKMSTAGVVSNTYNFPCSPGGDFPVGPLVQSSNGGFYSTTQNGGTRGEGIIYKLNSSFAVTVQHSFGNLFGDGSYPSAGMLLGTDGNYYGSTAEGGTFDDGTLFDSSLTGTYTHLYSFNNSANLMQMSPLSPPVEYTTGLLYGVTEFGGTANEGTVYSLSNGLTAFVNSPLFSGHEGSSVLLLGNHLTTASKVEFNGIPARFVVHSDNHMTAVVPSGASSGWITVTMESGTVKSRKVFVVQH